MTISYNILNLPEYIQDNWGSGEISHRYSYLADGTKVRHEYQDGQERFYAGSLVYDDGTFESASFGGGRIVGTDNGSEVHYFLTDHLGSTRVVAKVTSAGRDDLDRKDYYPFGKAWTQSGMPISENRYTFSGKEQVDVAIEDCITTPIHDFGARYYDPDGALFFQQDPLMEKYYSIGQYNYCMGNPICLIDPTGMRPRTKEDEEQLNKMEETAKNRRSELNAQRRNAETRKREIKMNPNLSSKKKERALSKAQATIDNIDTQLGLVNRALNAVNEIRNSDTVFTFTVVSNEPGTLLFNSDGSVTIQNEGSLSNVFHESIHALQYLEKLIYPTNEPTRFKYTLGYNQGLSELDAYGVQFSITGASSLPKSYNGRTPQRASDITMKWISGIFDNNGNLLYRDL